MTFLPRHLMQAFADALADTPVIFLTGARQVGKSTLVEHVLPQATYLTLDDAALVAAAQADPAGFIETHLHDALIIDEIQRVPALLQAIKLYVDRNRRPGQFVLTGSANVLALPQLSETLAGRMEVLTLRAFSQLELAAKRLPTITFLDTIFHARRPNWKRSDTREEIFARMMRGGYFESTRRTDVRREKWFRDYINGVLQREAQDIARVLDATKLPLLLTMLAGRSTQALNKTTLARDLAVTWNTVEHYLAILQTTYLTTSIPAWGKHVNVRAGRHPKMLINDSGLVAMLLRVRKKIQQQELSTVGTVFETFVGNELLRLASACPHEWEISHYRTQRNEEVDFVVERQDGSIVGIEVKLSNTVVDQDFRGLRALERDAGERFVRGVILYTGEATAPFGEKLAALPVTALWTDPLR